MEKRDVFTAHGNAVALPTFGRAAPAAMLTASLRAPHATITERLAAFDFAPDLASDIGSRRWFRGVATFLALAAAAASLWPSAMLPCALGCSHGARREALPFLKLRICWQAQRRLRC